MAKAITFQRYATLALEATPVTTIVSKSKRKFKRSWHEMLDWQHSPQTPQGNPWDVASLATQIWKKFIWKKFTYFSNSQQQETLALKWKKKNQTIVQRQHEVNFQHFRPCHSLWDWLKLTIHQLDLPCTSTPYELQFESSSFTFHISWYRNSPSRKSSLSPLRLRSAGLVAAASSKDVEKAKGDHTKVTHLQSIPIHPLEKPRGANWLSCRREKISKERICTEVSNLRLKDSSPKPTIPSAEPLPDVALSASKHHETSCSTKYFLCTVDNSDLCNLQFCCAWAMMLTDRPFSVKFLRMSWFNSSQQLSTTHPIPHFPLLLPSPSQWDGEETQE